MGFEEPSPIQEQTIPLVLDGYDVIGQAQTGTGKTAAFGIPLVQSITDHKHIQALIMTPTRELAIQVAEEVGKIGRTSRIKALPVYGGQPIERQIRALKSGVQIVIGTPGRLIDHINRNTIKLDHIKFWYWTKLTKCLIWALLTIWKKLCATCLLKGRRCCFPQPCRDRF